MIMVKIIKNENTWNSFVNSVVQQNMKKVKKKKDEEIKMALLIR